MTVGDGWYYDLAEIKKNSPSLKDGIDYTSECKYRTEGVQFITKLGQLMKLRYVTSATGAVYFHRFYMHHSFKEFHRLAVATACLFLAGKVEETPKKARDIFKTIQSQELINDSTMMTVFGEDPKEELMTMERILLKTIKFDLQVDHPYKFVIKYAKTFVGEKSDIEKVVQNCWGFINDSLATTLCLQWEPEILAIALMDLSCRITKYDITNWTNKQPGYKGKWWDQFVSDVSLELLESISHQVLDLYSKPASTEKTSTPLSGSSNAPPSRQYSDSSHKRSASSSEGNAAPPPKHAKTESNLAAPMISSSVPLPSLQAMTSQPPVVYPNPPVAVSASQYPSQPGYAMPPSQDSMPPLMTAVGGGYVPPPASYSGYPPPPPLHAIQQGAPMYSHQQPAYYSQRPPIPSTQAHHPGYYSQPPMMGSGYPGYPPPAAPYNQQIHPPSLVRGQQPGNRRNSSLKVLTDNLS